MSDSPNPESLSPAAIRRAVWSQSVQHHTVVYPAALGLLGGIAALTLTATPLVLGAAAVAGGVAVSALATHVFARRDRMAGRYLEGVRARLAQERQAHLADLSEDLQAVGAQDAVRQLARLVEKMSTFQTVLGERLSPSELTYARFSAIVESVFLAAVDNLRALHLARTALQAVDEPYLEQRLRTLAEAGIDSASDEVRALRQQREHGHALRQRMQDRLSQNELAMAELDRATAAVSDMKTGSRRPSLDMEAAMQELARMAQRSAAYGSS